MALTRDTIEALIGDIPDPHTGQTLREQQSIKGIAIDGDKAAVEVQLPYPALGWAPALKAEIEDRLGAHAGAVVVSQRIHSHKVQKDLTPLPGIRNIIAVASGKGGVGKSTTAANLALALVAEGARVGILDADIHGPSQPRMMGVSGKPDSTDGKTIEPKLAHGVEVMSIGFLIDEDTPMIWRGPMVTQALQQLLNDTNWHDLDYLVIDLPPGTGDIQLTLCQRVPVSGALIVTTPQDIALLDAKKALKMFEKVEVPVLGIVENMALHQCTNCGHVEHIFGEGGAARMGAQYDVPVLGALPLQMMIREQADGGTPTVAAAPDSPAAKAYRSIARMAAGRLSRQARNKKIAFPNIIIQNT